MWGGGVGGQGEEGGPGAGRAKLRLSRGFPCRLAYGVMAPRVGYLAEEIASQEVWSWHAGP